MTRWVRVMPGTLGLAAVVYGAASLTGGWLGEPPWWTVAAGPPRLVMEDTDEVMPTFGRGEWLVPIPKPREGREAISLALATVGLALFAWTAWPRKAPRARPSV